MTLPVTGPSQNLYWSELDCRDGTPYPHEWRATRAVQLARAFEHVRAAAGYRPIRVVSGYRTPRYNRKVGGAGRSQHVEGRALDMRPPDGMSVEEFHGIVLRVALEKPELGIRGVARYPSFVHMDTRPGDRVVQWRGKRARAEMT